jgi:hypothetical protein
LSVRSSDPGHVIAAYNPLLIVCFARPPRAQELDLMRSLVDEGLAAGIRGGLLYVVARKDMTGGVDPKVRATLEAMTKKNAQRSGSNAVVVLTSGFGGAMIRGVIAGLAMLTTQRKMLQVFGAAGDACRWLAKEHGLDADALLQAYRQATAHVPMPDGAQ